MRGGSFNNDRRNVRCAYRNRNNARNRNHNNGFRCVREVGPAVTPTAGVPRTTVRGSVRPAHVRAPHPAPAAAGAEDALRPGSARSSNERALPRGGIFLTVGTEGGPNEHR